jgi:hypothetical protein
MMKHSHCLSPVRATSPIDAPVTPTSYGRLFPTLPAFSADESFLYALGRTGGLCDCGADDDDEASLGSDAAGWPFFGQFVAHDITADRSAPGPHVDARGLRNARSPQLNLECLYGDGPVGHPFLYERADPAKLLVTQGGHDVLRNREGTAVIGDPRNDSHLFVSQMHLAFVHAHNACVDRTRASGTAEAQVFQTAARELRWTYQYAVLQEFLPRLVGQELVDSIMSEGRRFYRPDGVAFIPLEFADAAYRYGHSQIRVRYVVNESRPPASVFPGLMGFRPVPAELAVDWSRLFDVDGLPSAQRAKKMDGRLPSSLIALPVAITGECVVEEYHSLAVRDLERGQGVGLPSGEEIARFMGVRPLSPSEVGVGRTGWTGETPLWYYVLREADVFGGGDRLGPVGGRIVAEVLIGLLEFDGDSVVHAGPQWQPSMTLVELLTSARPFRS